APRTMRPPYGAITSSQKSWIRQEFGYPSILWSVDPEDWKKPGSSVVASRLVSGARPGGILLVHDIHAPTIDAVLPALDQLLAKGFQFVTVTQLIAMDGKG
ncbi:MAG: polysaccharide deacetylase family protein, partial [Verrucomicrobiales bacterium]|nr:polysaccharide deacetylase family protein [Verrucomicrobiales bacterium]